MIVLSYTCYSWALQDTKEWLINEVGVKILKVNNANDYISNQGYHVVQSKILFYVDKEQETMLMLKYPRGTFERHMA
jgi:hypothetical protein